MISRLPLPRMLPKLFVFDLDNCVWFPEMYQLWGHGGSPFKKAANGDLKDRGGERVYLMGDVRNIMTELKNDPKYADCQVAIASRCDEPSWAEECLRLFTLNDDKTQLGAVFSYKHIHKGNKQGHLRSIQKESGLSFSDMIFFDDQMGNIRDVSELGVTSVLTPHGVTRALWEKGLASYAAGERGKIVR